MFEVGREYSRQEISNILGGSLQSYLPVVGGRVVCGCFKPTPDENPDAPEKITYGDANRPEPALVASQVDPLPVFVYREDAAWEYLGRYVCVGHSRHPELLAAEMQANPARGVISGVLYFGRVGD